jgi:hypothetical protein
MISLASITRTEVVVVNQKEINIHDLSGAGWQKARELASQVRRALPEATKWLSRNVQGAKTN